MMVKRPTIAVLALACATASVVFADFYNRAPDVLPGLTSEMYTPAHWIAKMKDPDAVILAPVQIQAKKRCVPETGEIARPVLGRRSGPHTESRRSESVARTVCVAAGPVHADPETARGGHSR